MYSIDHFINCKSPRTIAVLIRRRVNSKSNHRRKHSWDSLRESFVDVLAVTYFNHIDKEQIILNGVKNTVSPLADSIKKTIRSRFPAFAYSSLASSSLAA
jgi:hypothetical protein